jgi:hypothetical protein
MMGQFVNKHLDTTWKDATVTYLPKNLNKSMKNRGKYSRFVSQGSYTGLPDCNVGHGSGGGISSSSSRTTILPVVLYGCETWSLTLREERRLRVFENRMFRRVIGPKRDEATGVWRKLHNEELNDLYSLPNTVRVVKSRRMGMWRVWGRSAHGVSGKTRGKEAIGDTQT